MRFSGSVVLVAGGTGALGSAVSRAFLDEGATLIVTYRTQGEFDALVAEAGQSATRLDGQRVDVTDIAAAHALIDHVIAKHGRLDALVNAVGGYAGGAPLWESDPAVFDRMLALNLRSGYALARAVGPVMLRQGSGRIVNVAAKAGVEHGAGNSLYAASKAAALSLMGSLASDLAGSGVCVNSVLPSTIDTEANRKAMPGADFSKWPKPKEIADVILFLCSAQARLIHGAAVPVYGNS
jgi:NAD(P)-dependent dehydrogenase (short-subunit alcohol dehydrogenase family)